MNVEDIERLAQKAAEHRLMIAGESLYDDGPSDGLDAPYCGCDTCIVREVITAAWPHLYALAHHPDTEPPV
jgi:hypothetical protein